MTIERLLEAGRKLDAGQLEGAERLYRQVADADPRSSIAIVGLARVAKRRGDDTGSTRLAQAALAIDPGNVAARRLLEEHTAGREEETPAVSPAPSSPGSGSPVAGDGEDWPWPDLEEQLARHRGPQPGRLARLLKRG